MTEQPSDLADELTAMWDDDQRLARRVVAASRTDPTLRRIFLFELPQAEWPEGYAACRDVAHRNARTRSRSSDGSGRQPSS